MTCQTTSHHARVRRAATLLLVGGLMWAMPVLAQPREDVRAVLDRAIEDFLAGRVAQSVVGFDRVVSLAPSAAPPTTPVAVPMLLLPPTTAPPSAPIAAPVPAPEAVFDGATPDELQPVSPMTPSASRANVTFFLTARRAKAGE